MDSSTKRFTPPDGVAIAYYEWSPELPGPAVVLQHGFVGDGTMAWVKTGVVAALQKAGRRVVVIDARGHGRSDKPHDPSFYGESTMARDLMLLVEQLGIERYDLVGYSMGSTIALLVAAQDPRVRRLVIGGVGEGTARIGSVPDAAARHAALADALEVDDRSKVPPAMAPFRMFADAISADRKALAAVARAFHKERIPFERIAVPTLLLCGESDPLAAAPEALVAALPNARVERVPGDHLSTLVAPRYAAALVEFLSG